MSKLAYRRYPHLGEIEAFVEGVKALKPRLILLFGSVAKGDFTQYSDADVLVLFDEPIDWLDVYRFSQGMVQPLVSTRLEVEARIRDGDTLFIQVLKEGVVLFEEEGASRRLLGLAEEAERRHGLVRTERGWRRRPKDTSPS